MPLERAERVIRAFGGSTLENTGTIDELTIANTWARAFNAALGPTYVKNLGTGGVTSSLELIKFQGMLREVPRAEWPSIAIFFDGYNESLFGFQCGAGSLQKDLSMKLRAMVEQQDARLSLHTASRWLAARSRLWQRAGARTADAWLFPLPPPDPSRDRLDQAVRSHTSNAAMIGATCASFDTLCLFVLQPLVLTKRPLAPLEQPVLERTKRYPRFGEAGVEFVRAFHRQTTRALADHPSFSDASGVLDGRTQPDFYDLGHTGAFRPPVIGERTAALLLERLGEASATD